MNTGSDLDILLIIWESGVVVKGVLIALILASIISWGIVWKKKNTISEMEKNNKQFLDVYQSSESIQDVSVKSDMLPFSPFREMFQEGYGEFIKVKKAYAQSETPDLKIHFQKFGVDGLERSLKKGVNSSNRYLDRHLSTLASVGSISPFVGLFGTVWGIIGAFQGLAGGGGSLEAVAPGIAEALVATAVGLFAAIPAVWFFNSFSNKISSMNNEMESFGQDFLNTIERSLID